MSEVAFWSWCKNNITHEGYWGRVENSVGMGWPDVHYCVRGTSGWIELKEIPSWPKRRATKVRIEHFTPDQRYWLRDYVKNGGKAWLFLRVADTREYLLFRGDNAFKVGEMTKTDMVTDCDLFFFGPLDTEFYEMLMLMLTDRAKR